MAENLEVGINANVNGQDDADRLASAVASVGDALRELVSEAKSAAGAMDRVERSVTGAQASARGAAKEIRGTADAVRELNKIQNSIGVNTFKKGASGSPVADKNAIIEEQRLKESIDATNAAREQSIRIMQRQTVAANVAASKAARASGAGIASSASTNVARPSVALPVGLDKDYQAAASATRAYYTQVEYAATANERASQAIIDNAHNLSTQRYALYDVANTFTVAGVAAIGLATATAATAVQMERAFANVVRTTETAPAQVDALRDSFDELYKTIPASFSDLTDIGALGGQLGVARSQIVDFTKQVAMFSATTNVSVDESATAFGRLDALLPDVGGNYERLGDAILTTGVNAVATESQIIKTSQEIAATGTQYGFTADQVIGLSSAFASLGVAPESARGTFQRATGQINKAVNAGGEDLQRFADLANMSSEEFANAWRSKPLQAFQGVLKGINEQGTQGQATLAQLGITAVRDGNNIAKLAQNADVLNTALADSAEGFAGNNAVADQYSIISSTVAEKLVVLKNNFLAFVGSLGEGANGLGVLIDGLTAVIGFADKLVSNPLSQPFIGLGLALTAVVGGFALLVAALLRGRAGLLALNAALADYVATSQVASGSTLTLRGSLTALSAQLIGTGGAAKTAGTGIAVLGTATKLLTFVGLLTALPAVSDALGDVVNKIRGFNTETDGIVQRLTDTTNAMTNLAYASQASFGGIDRAIANITGHGIYQVTTDVKALDDTLAELAGGGAADQAAEQFAKIKRAAEEQGVSLDELRKLFPEYFGVLDSGQASTDATKQGIVEIGEEADVTADAMSNLKDEIANAFSNENALGAFYSDFQALLDGIVAGGTAFDVFSAAGYTNLQNLQTSIASTVAAGAALGLDATESVSALFARLRAEGVDTANLLASISKISIPGLNVNQLKAQNADSSKMSAGSNALAQSLSKLAGVAPKAAGGVGKVGKAAKSAAKEVVTLKDYANDLRSVFDRSFELRFGATGSLDSITTAWNDIAAENKRAADEIVDYQKNIVQLRTDIQGLQADIQSLTADRAIQEYFLGVAKNYGDSLREGSIAGDIAKIDADIAAKRADLAEKSADVVSEQDKLNNSTANTTTKQIEQRTKLSELVEKYQDYIVQLASSGLSQTELAAKTAQLKQEFISQATQLGFTQAQVGNAARAFDDMTLAIQRVPRNITVSANTNPAIQALNEFLAKANNSRANVAVGGTGAGGGGVGDAGYRAGELFGTEFKKAARRLMAFDIEASLGPEGRAAGARSTIGGITMYSGGGYTGKGGKYEPAGIVHKDEFVFTKEQTNRIGVQQLSALANGNPAPVAPRVTVNSGSSNGPAVMMIDPAQFERLVASGNVVVQIGQDQVARAANAGNLNTASRGANG